KSAERHAANVPDGHKVAVELEEAGRVQMYRSRQELQQRLHRYCENLGIDFLENDDEQTQQTDGAKQDGYPENVTPVVKAFRADKNGNVDRGDFRCFLDFFDHFFCLLVTW